MTVKAAAPLRDVLSRLEKAYGRLAPPGDPVEAGILALLATEAPEMSGEPARDRIREAFVDWNEARVADPWDLTSAADAGGSAPARAFARAALRFLESMHTVLNRCSFDVPAGEAVPDWSAMLDKMRGATPAVRAVCLASIAPDGAWAVTPEILKAASRLGIAGKTTSATKIAAALADSFPPEERLRLHYVLARYGSRGKDDPDPFDSGKPAKAPRAAKAKSGK